MEVNKCLIKDNLSNKEMLKDRRLPKAFPSEVIEAIKTRTLFTMQSKQKEAYL